MPFFKKADNPVVVWRQYEFNAEALDGRIILISNEEPCALISHHPNKQWGYNIGTIKLVSAGEGWPEVERLGHAKELPNVFYELVPKNEYQTYLKIHPEYKDNLETASEPKVVPPIKQPKPTIIDIPKIKKEVPGLTKKRLTKTRLAKDSEAPIYTYKTPGQRF